MLKDCIQDKKGIKSWQGPAATLFVPGFPSLLMKPTDKIVICDSWGQSGITRWPRTLHTTLAPGDGLVSAAPDHCQVVPAACPPPTQHRSSSIAVGGLSAFRASLPAAGPLQLGPVMAR